MTERSWETRMRDLDCLTFYERLSLVCQIVMNVYDSAVLGASLESKGLEMLRKYTEGRKDDDYLRKMGREDRAPDVGTRFMRKFLWKTLPEVRADPNSSFKFEDFDSAEAIKLIELFEKFMRENPTQVARFGYIF